FPGGAAVRVEGGKEVRVVRFMAARDGRDRPVERPEDWIRLTQVVGVEVVETGEHDLRLRRRRANGFDDPREPGGELPDRGRYAGLDALQVALAGIGDVVDVVAAERDRDRADLAGMRSYERQRCRELVAAERRMQFPAFGQPGTSAGRERPGGFPGAAAVD